jgi:hypothetical protein
LLIRRHRRPFVSVKRTSIISLPRYRTLTLTGLGLSKRVLIRRMFDEGKANPSRLAESDGPEGGGSGKKISNDDGVLALLAVVPDDYQAAIWLGAGEGMRLGEVLGIEDGARCVDHRHQEIHVVQQLRFHKVKYGGFYLAPPKAGSTGDVDLDDTLASRSDGVPWPCCSLMIRGRRLARRGNVPLPTPLLRYLAHHCRGRPHRRPAGAAAL